MSINVLIFTHQCRHEPWNVTNFRSINGSQGKEILNLYLISNWQIKIFTPKTRNKVLRCVKFLMKDPILSGILPVSQYTLSYSCCKLQDLGDCQIHPTLNHSKQIQKNWEKNTVLGLQRNYEILHVNLMNGYRDFPTDKPTVHVLVLSRWWNFPSVKYESSWSVPSIDFLWAITSTRNYTAVVVAIKWLICSW